MIQKDKTIETQDRHDVISAWGPVIATAGSPGGEAVGWLGVPVDQVGTHDDVLDPKYYRKRLWMGTIMHIVIHM